MWNPTPIKLADGSTVLSDSPEWLAETGEREKAARRILRLPTREQRARAVENYINLQVTLLEQVRSPNPEAVATELTERLKGVLREMWSSRTQIAA